MRLTRHDLRTLARGALRPPDNDSAFLLDVHRRAVPQARMARYDESDPVDLAIVGCGAGGGTLAQRLARKGWRVVVLEAGPFWDPDRDWVSDEAGRHGIYWTEERIIGGADPVELGKNNCGRGVGGSMVHYAGYCPRFHPSDFEVHSRDGVGRLADRLRRPQASLRAPGAQAAGRRGLLALGRPAPGTRTPPIRSPAAPTWPARVPASSESRCGSGRWGSPTGTYRVPPPLHLPGLLPAGLQGQRQGLDPDHPRPRRPHPWRRDPHRVHGQHDRDRPGRPPRHRRALPARGARTLPACPHGGRRRVRDRNAPAAAELRQPPFPPRAVPTDHDLVGRYVMVQGAPQAPAVFAQEVRTYKAPPPEIYPSSSTRPTRPAGRPGLLDPDRLAAARRVGRTRAAHGHWGHALRGYMRDYIHWDTLGALSELLPQPGNRVTLATE